jgi:Na+/glutamate symporter
MKTPYMADSRLGNALFLLFGGAWLGIVVGFIVGCAGAVAQWLIRRWKRHTLTRNDRPP